MGKGVGRECPVCEEEGGGVQEGVVVMEGRIGQSSVGGERCVLRHCLQQGTLAAARWSCAAYQRCTWIADHSRRREQEERRRVQALLH